MSVSTKSGGCSKSCIPCQPKNIQVFDGQVSTAGGSGTMGDAADALCPGADDACKASLAKKIADAIRSHLPWSPFGDTCYECNDLTVNMSSAKCECGEFTGDINIAGAGSPGSVASACKEVPCGAQPCGGPGQPPCGQS